MRRKDSYQRQRRLRDENRDKILTIVHDSKKVDSKNNIIEGATFTELQKKTMLSPAGLTKILQNLVTEKAIEKTLIKIDIIIEKGDVYSDGKIKPEKRFTKGMKPVYVLTEKGQAEYKGIWLLMHTLLELKEMGSSYSGGLLLTQTNNVAKPLPNIICHETNYPSSLSIGLNTFAISANTQRDFIKNVINQLNKTDLSKIPDGSKSIFAFELNWKEYKHFVKDVKNFIEDVSSDKEFLTDPKLEFKDTDLYKLSLLESYLYNADLFEDSTYQDKFQKLVKKEKFVSDLLSLGMWSDYLDKKTLREVEKALKSGEEPLSNKKLAKKLIIKAGNGFYVPLYDYVEIIKILNYNDLKLRNRLQEYENINKYRPDMSLVLKIQKELRGESE